MTLKTPAAQALTDQAAFYSTDLPWVKTVTYNGSSIPAKVTYGEDLEQGGGSKTAFAEIVVKDSDVSDPNYRDPVVIESLTWYVRNITKGDGNNWRLKCYRDERPVL